jgi:sugar lactone lactonase YvrE
MRTETMRALRAAAAAAVLAFATGVASAHEGEVHLDDIISHVGERIPATAEGDAKIHKAYVRLGNALAKDGEGLLDALKKLQKVAKEAGKALSGDATLADLLEEALADAEEALAAQPTDVEDAIDGIESEKSRKSPEKLALKALLAADAAKREKSAGDVAGRIAQYRKAATGFSKAAAKAEKTVDKQGGAREMFTAAVAGHIYAAIGSGTAGHNGDGLAARRSSLYWVEEVRFGPDGLLYILDWNNHMLRRRESDGTITRLAGSGTPGDSEGPALATAFNHPSAVDFDGTGRVFIAAWHNHKVKVYDPNEGTPIVYTIAGGPAGTTGDGGSGTDARFNLVPGIAFVPTGHPLGAGNLLVTDATSQVVRMVKLATDPVTDTNVAGTEVETGNVERVFGTGTQGNSGDGGQALSANLGFSRAQNAESDGRMVFDAAGNCYLVNGVMHCIRKVAPDGTITTVAGTGVAGFSGDGGSATSAQLNFPADVAVAADGTIFISDQFNHCIRKVDTLGNISTIAGQPGVSGHDGDGGLATDATFHRPSGLELDANGNLYVCDKTNSAVRVIASAAPGGLMVPVDPYILPAPRLGAPPAKGPAGTIDTFAGSGSAGFSGDGLPARESQFYWPQDVTVTPSSGQLIVVDWNNHRIRRVEADGTVETIIGVGELGETNGPALSVRLNHPTEVSFNPFDGELYLAGWHFDKLKKLVSASNELQVISKPDGKRAFSGDDGPVGLAEFNLPSSIKFDAAGNAYVGDEGNRRVRKIAVGSGTVTTLVGDGNAGFNGDGLTGTLTQLNLPVGQSAQPGGKICLDPTESFIYIADTDNHRIRRYNMTTMIVDTVAGDGTPAHDGDGGLATEASLHAPTDVDCDAAGNIYICERDGHTVRKVAIGTGIITTVAGVGGEPGYEGDGGEASSSKLFLPSGIYVDRATGRLYIADTYNSVVRVVWE